MGVIGKVATSRLTQPPPADLVATITGASPGRTVSDIGRHHEATGFEVDRKAKAIFGEIPYSLRLGVAK